MSQPLGGGRESWATRVGVILAVTGSAVGLGNFLRFPGMAAQYGGGVFMVPYVVAFLLLGLPIAFVEWSMGRYGGACGYNSAPGVFRAVCGRRWASYLGMLGPLIPVVIYMYYVFVEAWCLGYAWNYVAPYIGAGTGLDLGDNPERYSAFFDRFVGIDENGASFVGQGAQALIFLAICFVLNFYLIYRGLQKGIEWFCKFAMPALVLCALIVLVRVLTLGTPVPEKPEQNVINGLGYMWNPVHQPENLAPGDKAVRALVHRATVDAVSGADDPDGLGSFTVEDPNALAWALKRTGWKPRWPGGQPPGPVAAPAGESPTVLANRYTHPKTPVVLAVDTDQARFRNLDLLDGGGRLTLQGAAAEDEAVAGLLAMLPVDSADVERDEKALRSFAIQRPEAFHAALRAVGWERAGVEEGLTGRWQHEESRLVLQVASDEAVVAIPTFLETLSNPEIWLAAAGQIFFSLSVGFGIIITYSSYMRRDDDVALSSLTAAAGNGFCEVALGGLIVIPATFVFLGVSAVANPPGTFGMGFVSLPSVFNQMGDLGSFFGFLFFFLLFLAAVTSSLSMLQPAIALFEEGLGIGRKASVAMLGFITLVGALFVVYFSKGLLALDTVDFWVGAVCIYMMATIQVIIYGWVLGVDRGMKEIDRGAEIRLPRILGFVIKYVSPLYLLIVFATWSVNKLPGRLKAVGQVEEGQPPVVALSLGLIVVVLIFFALIITRANQRWDKQEARQTEVSP
jgi:SNF family Na+-dependent transporter